MLKRPKLLLSLITILVSLFFWGFFYLNLPVRIGFPSSNLLSVYANYDGPNYMIIAKCGYNSDCIRSQFSLPQPLEYYPAHLPGYPLIIRIFSYIFTSTQAMLFATLLGSIFLTLSFYQLLNLFFNTKKSFCLTLIFLFFPARLFILRQIGAPETWFLGFTIASIYHFKKQKYLVSALMAALAQFFKSPGIILFAAYFFVALTEFLKTKKIIPVLNKYIYYLLVPITAIMVFSLYQLQTGDFWAYFHSGDNFHLSFLPYTVFISNRSWINTIWLEDVIYIYLIAYFGVYKLYKKFKLDILAVYPALFLLATIMVAHRDISRYLAPVYPFLFIAYGKTLNSKPLKTIFILLLPAIFLYALNFIIGNTAPIADWTPYFN